MASISHDGLVRCSFCGKPKARSYFAASNVVAICRDCALGGGGFLLVDSLFYDGEGNPRSWEEVLEDVGKLLLSITNAVKHFNFWQPRGVRSKKEEEESLIQSSMACSSMKHVVAFDIESAERRYTKELREEDDKRLREYLKGDKNA